MIVRNIDEEDFKRLELLTKKLYNKNVIIFLKSLILIIILFGVILFIAEISKSGLPLLCFFVVSISSLIIMIVDSIYVTIDRKNSLIRESLDKKNYVIRILDLDNITIGTISRIDKSIWSKEQLIDKNDIKKYLRKGILNGKYDEQKQEYIPIKLIKKRRKMKERGYVNFRGQWMKKKTKRNIIKKEKKEERKREEKRKKIKKKEIELGLNNNFVNFSPYEFEEKIAKLFRKMGYNARTTQASGDFGIDVIAVKDGKKIGIQVKRYNQNNTVGVKPVMNTIGALSYYDADRAIFITSSSFTRAAEKFGERCDEIELWNGYILKSKFREYYLDK